MPPRYTNEASKNLPPFLEKIKTTPCVSDHIDYPVYKFLRENDVKIDAAGSEICQFLKNKSIFVTGATGFLGRLLLEKLLRACIDIDTIFVLVRPKRGKDQSSRLSELLDDVVFEKLADMHPNFQNKIRIIHGDLSLPGLGINDSDRQLLREKVEIIFHGAATTRFTEVLSRAVQINIKGTMELLKLAKEIKKLVSFVHVSTAFSNCNRNYTEERVYEPLLPPKDLISLAEGLSEEMLEKITPSLLGKMPNTYTFTKQIAETIVQSEEKNLPLCIYRPCIVASTVTEPIRNWNSDLFSLLGVVVAIMCGLSYCMLGYRNKKCHIIPADYVVNATVACAHATSKNRVTGKCLTYNHTPHKDNPVFWKDINSDRMYSMGRRAPSKNLIRYPAFEFIPSYTLYVIMKTVYHTMFAYVFDFASRMLGKEPRLVQAYQKMHKLIGALEFFTTHEFDYESTNINRLWDSLGDQDKKAFPFDMKKLNWTEYFTTFLIGARVYLLKENLDNLKETRVLGKWFYITLKIYRALVYGMLIYFSSKLLGIL